MEQPDSEGSRLEGLRRQRTRVRLREPLFDQHLREQEGSKDDAESKFERGGETSLLELLLGRDLALRQIQAVIVEPVSEVVDVVADD